MMILFKEVCPRCNGKGYITVGGLIIECICKQK
jgi:hypothetical protein